MADVYLPGPSPPPPQSNQGPAWPPTSFETWFPSSSGDPPAPASEAGSAVSPAGAAAAPPAAGMVSPPPPAAVSSLDSMYGSVVSPVLLLAGLLVLSVVLSSVLFAGVFVATRRFRGRRALRSAAGGGGLEGGPEMPLAQSLAGGLRGGRPALSQPSTVVVQPDMSVSLCVKDEPNLPQDAKDADAAAPGDAAGGGSSSADRAGGSGGGGEPAGRVGGAAEGAAAAAAAAAAVEEGPSTSATAAVGRQAAEERDAAEAVAHASLMQASGYAAADMPLAFGLRGPAAESSSETSSEADLHAPTVFATPWAPAWTPFWHMPAGRRHRQQQRALLRATSMQGPPAPLEVVDVRHMAEP
ncbi:hypothetical protein ABPG75_002942 [Micractinium tetrahymenae]